VRHIECLVNYRESYWVLR